MNTLTMPYHNLHNQLGRSLIEVMISITIGLVISAGTLALFVSTQKSNVQVDAKAKLAQDANYALNLIGKLIREAGYGEIISTVRTGDAARILTAQTIHGCKGGYAGTGTVPALTVVACNANPAATSSDSITLTQQVESVNCQGAAAPIAGLPTFSQVNGWGGDILGQCVQAVSAANGMALSQVTHRLAVSTAAASAYTPNPRPALRVLGSGDTIAQPLVDNIDQLRLIYLVSTANNGEATQYMTATQVNAANNWQAVVGVDVCIVLSTENTGLSTKGTTANSYVDCDNTTVAGSDTRLRASFKRQFMLRNRVTPISHSQA